jgi:lysyl-tRNA synthetase class 2
VSHLYWQSNTDPDIRQQYFELRARTIQKLKETQSPNPYPHKFHVSQSITSFIEEYNEEGLISAGQKLEDVIVSLSGRVHNIRSSGNKLKFYDLHGEGAQVQILANVR